MHRYGPRQTSRPTRQPDRRPSRRQPLRQRLRAMLGALAATAALAAPLAVALAPARAEEPATQPVLVELFTSQGCSSCPPADELLGRLTARPDVIALTFNVDYWDYLGWKDSLAKPAYSERQRAYARTHQERTVYTPQMIVAGRDALVGSHEEAVEKAIAAQKPMPPHARVSLTIDGGAIRIVVSPTSPAAMPCDVVLAAYRSRVEQRIQRGENQGRSIVYHNAVRELTTLGEWSGADEKTFTAPLTPGADGYAVMLQAGDGGPILAAAKLDR